MRSVWQGRRAFCVTKRSYLQAGTDPTNAHRPVAKNLLLLGRKNTDHHHTSALRLVCARKVGMT